jgi:F420-0:gamma-glutamyl ligase-like protein
VKERTLKNQISSISSLVYLLSVVALNGCYTSLPGTHVEVIERDGRKAYVVGAVGMGTNRGLACRAAVTNGVAEAARKFAHERDDLVEIAEDLVDVDDGRPLVDTYARSLLDSARVRDEMFNPVEHTCWVTVDFIAPLMARDGFREFLKSLKSSSAK